MTDTELERYVATSRPGETLVAWRDRIASEPVEQSPAQVRAAAADWREEQRRCFKVFKGQGCDAYWLSQPRPTKQTRGLGDVFGFTPADAPRQRSFWWETKHGAGELEEDQQLFRERCIRTETAHGFGNERDAEEFCIAMGFSRRDPHGNLERVRRAP